MKLNSGNFRKGATHFLENVPKRKGKKLISQREQVRVIWEPNFLNKNL